jgi:hypothetical protein
LTNVTLYDRPNSTDNVLAGTLLFSDGTSVAVGQLPNDGTGLNVPFPSRSVAWVRFRVDNAVGSAIGLSEIEAYGSSGGATNSTNYATSSAVSVSSENSSTGQLGIKAIDGVKTGYPGDYTKEWATMGQLVGAWIQLNWGSPITTSKVILYDRPNLTDNITAGTLLFSDGTSVAFGQLPNDGSPLVVTFPSKSVVWVRVRVDGGTGSNIGLCEMEVY